MNTKLLVYPSALFLMTVSSGCAPRTNSNIERVQNELVVLKSSPLVATRAPAELQDATQAVQRAEDTWNSTRDSKEAEHLTYLAEKRIEIARVKTNQEIAESEAVRLSQARDRSSTNGRAAMANAAALEADSLIRERQAEIESLKSQLNELRAIESTRGLSLTLGDVMFETNRAELRSGAARKLTPLANYIRNHPQDTITIEGHTDNIGNANSNLDLSARRAQAVKNVLVAEGINSSRIVTRGMGEQYPLIANTSEAGRLQNRRVEIIISGISSGQLIR